MRTFRFIILFLPILSLATPASAQPEPGDIGVFFDEFATTSAAPIPLYPNFDMYVVAFDVPGDIEAWEGRLSIIGNVIITSVELLGGGIGLPEDPLSVWHVELPTCVPGAGQVTLARVTCVPLAPDEDVQFCLLAGLPRSIEADMPAYRACGGAWTAFGFAQIGGGFLGDGCAIGSSTGVEPIAREDVSWSGIKSIYR